MSSESLFDPLPIPVWPDGKGGYFAGRLGNGKIPLEAVILELQTARPEEVADLYPCIGKEDIFALYAWMLYRCQVLFDGASLRAWLEERILYRDQQYRDEEVKAGYFHPLREARNQLIVNEARERAKKRQ